MTNNNDEILLKGRLNGTQRNKVKGLLNMMYSPRELAEEIGFSKNQVYRVYLPAGCPHTKNPIGRILIHGVSFRLWFEETYKKTPIKKGQAYCVSCKKVVLVSNPKRFEKGRLSYDLFACPICGNTTAKIADAKRKKND